MIAERVQLFATGLLRLVFHNDVLLLVGLALIVGGLYGHFGRDVAMIAAGSLCALVGLATAKR